MLELGHRINNLIVTQLALLTHLLQQQVLLFDGSVCCFMNIFHFVKDLENFVIIFLFILRLDDVNELGQTQAS